MNLELTDEKTRALLNLLVEAIEADRYPFPPRIRVLREILGEAWRDGSATVATARPTARP